MLLASFALAALVIRYQPFVENHILRPIGPKVAIPLATVLFAFVASAPFSVTDALAIMNGVVFGRFWGSVIDVIGIIGAGIIGYWINRHATHLMDLHSALARLPGWVKRFKVGSPMFLIVVRIIPGFGGTVATATAAAMKVPLWIHVATMSAVAIPLCVLLTLFGDQVTGLVHGAEARAHMYILHHRPHWHMHFRKRAPRVPSGPTQ
ncbi:MAG TPA: VTT domain-containing protein [Candidatus Rubrimentiphilum sp.]|nr:VTT domain-containing protein [Candidatus Rubrimentiphilum sp.]